MNHHPGTTMEITDENPQDWQKNWAVDLKVMRLSNGDRAYDKTGMHIVMVGRIDGKDVPLVYHLTKLDAVNLSHPDGRGQPRNDPVAQRLLR